MINTAAGYPACPDHTEKDTPWGLLEVEARPGMQLTEKSCEVSGGIRERALLGPAGCFLLQLNMGLIGRDRLKDYAERKGISKEVAAKWLAPNLNQ